MPCPDSRLRLLDLGRTAYEHALAVQRELHAQRKSGAVGDTLILTEHEPVITTGQGADFRHLLAPLAAIAAAGIALVRVERGGDVTYHGPGQLVAYPILDLRGRGRDVHRYVRGLEETAIRFAAAHGVHGERRPGAPGVYVGAGKLASIGVFVSRWVTLHGVAINLAPNPAHWALVRPCGLPGTAMTSLQLLTGAAPAYAEAARAYAAIFADVFGYEAAIAPREAV